jgi:hypothetical protein
MQPNLLFLKAPKSKVASIVISDEPNPEVGEAPGGGEEGAYP